MKIAVSGKGGAGKTTISGTIARSLARSGLDVTAIDADVNPMLGISLGLGMDGTERLAGIRQELSEGHADHEHEHAHTIDELVERFGEDAPDGVRVVVGPEAHHDQARELAQVAQQLVDLRGVAGDRRRLADVEAV